MKESLMEALMLIAFSTMQGGAVINEVNTADACRKLAPVIMEDTVFRNTDKTSKNFGELLAAGPKVVCAEKGKKEGSGSTITVSFFPLELPKLGAVSKQLNSFGACEKFMDDIVKTFTHGGARPYVICNDNDGGRIKTSQKKTEE